MSPVIPPIFEYETNLSDFSQLLISGPLFTIISGYALINTIHYEYK